MTTTPDINAQSSDHIGFHSCATVPTSLARQLKLERDQALAGKAAAERQRDVLLEALKEMVSVYQHEYQAGEGWPERRSTA